MLCTSVCECVYVQCTHTRPCVVYVCIGRCTFVTHRNCSENKVDTQGGGGGGGGGGGRALLVPMLNQLSH